jgi:hypothetical protein
MTVGPSASPRIPPPPPPPVPTISVELICEAPGYSQTFTTSQVQPNGFYPWTVADCEGPGNSPTSFTLRGVAFASLGRISLPVTVELAIVGSGASAITGNTEDIDLSASASVEGSATATILVNLADYGATPKNCYQVTAQTSVAAKTSNLGSLAAGCSSPLFIYLPE